MMSNYTNGLDMHFMEINPGSFLMGNPNDETYYGNEKQHRVNLTKPFSLQTTQVTVGQWRAFAEETGYKTEAENQGEAWCYAKNGWKIPVLYPTWGWEKKAGIQWDNPGYHQTDEHPVTCVSWHDTHAFMEWLNQKESVHYRLPTEAEWEYACRAGTETPYSFGEHLSPKWANYNSYDYRLTSKAGLIYKIQVNLYFFFWKRRPHRVMQYAANPWGVYGMHGHVWEWCQDSSDYACEEKNENVITDTYVDDITDPLCKKGARRMLRGGSWFYTSPCCTSSFRRSVEPNKASSGVGFRLALDR